MNNITNKIKNENNMKIKWETTMNIKMKKKQ